MACKKGKPGNPCCSPCISCTGTFRIDAVTIAGTWATPASEDDFAGCPTCIIPGTFVFANTLSSAQLAGTDPTPSGEQQCYRFVNHIGDYCQNQIWDHETYVGFFGQWKKTHWRIYAREWTQVEIALAVVKVGSATRIAISAYFKWIVQFVSRKCEYTTTGFYGTLAEAKTAELDAQCLFGTGPDANYQDSSGAFWKLCEKVEVKRSIHWYLDITGACKPAICGLIPHYETVSERWFYDYGLYGNCGNDCDVYVRWKKDTDGSTPVLGDFTSSQQFVWSEGTSGPSLTGNGTLTGTITGQELKVYNGTGLLATLKEPCWPTAPTVDVVCQVEEPPPPEDP